MIFAFKTCVFFGASNVMSTTVLDDIGHRRQNYEPSIKKRRTDVLTREEGYADAACQRNFMDFMYDGGSSLPNATFAVPALSRQRVQEAQRVA